MIRNLTLILTGVFIALLGLWSLPKWQGDAQRMTQQLEHRVPENEIHGEHGGRLLVDGDFAVEVTIYETGMPPEFRIYAYQHGEPVAAEGIELSITLERLGGQIDTFQFQPRQDFLRGHGLVEEPHSFDVEVVARYAGKEHRWSYASPEGRTRIAAAMAAELDIASEHAGPATIVETLTLRGQVQTDPARLSRVKPRFPGVIQRLPGAIGDVVSPGDTLATVQSNESLQTYAVRAPIGGLILTRDAQIGEATADRSIFTIADLSNVWIELDVFGRNLNRIQIGQSVTIETFDGYTKTGEIDWISPLVSHASQSVKARVIVANENGVLRPGQFIRANVRLATHDVDLAVRPSALQRFREFNVVFAQFGEFYEVRMLELGRRDGDWVEVVAGLRPGTAYVTGNSYLIKADIEKSGAQHAH